MRLHVFLLLTTLVGYIFCCVSSDKKDPENLQQCSIENRKEICDLPQELKDEIASYKPVVDKIIDVVVNGELKGNTYNFLADFVDKFGPRMSGTQTLEDSIDYVLNKSTEYGLQNVRTESVPINHWVRGSESAILLAPRVQTLPMLGLGSSVGTPANGIRAEVIVVNSFGELDRISDQVTGKIVVFNQEFRDYNEAVYYRWKGSNASAYGAVATLIKSVTPFSLHTPHTGWNEYTEGLPKIPTAAITVEDAGLLRRLQDKGEKLEIELKMDAQNLPKFMSRNAFAEIIGGEAPDKRVIVSGHIDSWDVGQGAMDDGAGIMLSWNSLLVLKKLGLTPKRTIQMIFYTAEEVNLCGAYAHYDQHKNESDNIDFVMESDFGTFKPIGLHYAGPDYGACILKEILSLLAPINATQLKRAPVVGSDIGIWTANGMPGAILWSENDRYFWYHHTHADTLDVENPESLDLNTALWASVSYIIADLSIDMPKV